MSSRRWWTVGFPVLVSLAGGWVAGPTTLLAQASAGKRYAFLVGVQAYQHARLRDPALKYAVQDVADLKEVLDKSDYTVTLLTDKTGEKNNQLLPTRENIDRELTAILRTATEHDTVLVGLAGHGLQFTGKKDAYFCPVDARPFEDETATLISITRVYQQLDRSFAGVKVVLVDACRNDPDPTRGRGLDADSSPPPPKGVSVLFSCSAGQKAFENDDLRHGVFFYYVLKGLEGAAADKGKVTFDDLSKYVRQQVPDKVEELTGGRSQQLPNEISNKSGKPHVLAFMAKLDPKSTASEIKRGSPGIDKTAGPSPKKVASTDVAPKTKPSVTENPFPKRIQSPELIGGSGWLNTASEISVNDLRGKVVLLHFWTCTSINCLHNLVELNSLQRKYDKQLVVIGVHSPKFTSDKSNENLRRAVVRCEVEHPVLNDSEMKVWANFAVRAWPTVTLIDPEGYVCGQITGEGNRDVLETAIDRILAYHGTRGTLNESPVHFDLERDKAAPTALSFPGSVAADARGSRLFISDTNHNRVIVTTLAGKLLTIIGNGVRGRDDGPVDEATFSHPQGLALVDEKLYVADTENHLIRRIDLVSKTVNTIAGIGQLATANPKIAGDGVRTPLNSPWGLVHVGGKLYVSMTGWNQVWVLSLASGQIGPFAGSGQLAVLDGPLAKAAMAQPTGIASDGKSIFAVDSDGAAVRMISLDPNGAMTTVVGNSGPDSSKTLFSFGDRDGAGIQVKLQYPLGIVCHAGQLYIADSHNNKIKLTDPRKNSAKGFLGDGIAGGSQQPPRFYEPGGLSVAADTLYVADTNNHRICKIGIKSGQTETLQIPELLPPSR